MSTEKGTPLDGSTPVGKKIFDSGLSYPIAAIFQSAVDHNSKEVSSYLEDSGFSFAPHGKTTMAPYLIEQQLRDGAWGITAATVWQAMRMLEMGVDRILIANEVVVPDEIRWLKEATARGHEIYCYVDSLAGVEIMESALAEEAPADAVRVLIEVGLDGARTGVRDAGEARNIASAVARSRRLALAGLAGFEGVISVLDVGDPNRVIHEYLDKVVSVTNALAEADLFEPSPDVIVTAGGSAYFDHVVTRFEELDDIPHLRKVMRSGCYITHDDGGYENSSPMGSSQRLDGRLRPAIELWAPVLSRPEPDLALVGLGKRDVTYDGIFPLAKKVRRVGGNAVEQIEPIRVSMLNDQHSYLYLTSPEDLAVGDLVGFGISHPCTTFDKWRTMLMVEDDYTVTEQITTVF